MRDGRYGEKIRYLPDYPLFSISGKLEGMKYYRLIPTLAIALVSTFSVLANEAPVGTGPYLSVAEGNPLSKRNRAVKLLADQSIHILVDGNSRAISGKTKHSAEAGVGQSIPAKSVTAVIVTTSEMVPVVDEIFDAQPKSLVATGVSFVSPSAQEAEKINEVMQESKAPVMVIMGHVTPELESYINGTATPPDGAIARAVAKAKRSSDDPKKQMDKLVDELVLQAASDLVTINPSLSDKLRAGSIYVTGARYNNLTGQVHLVVVPPIVSSVRYFASDNEINHPDLIVSPSS